MYSRWSAAFRLASKGRTMADSSYDSEVKSIQAFLTMQHPTSAQALNPSDVNFQAENYVCPRYLRKLKTGKSVGCAIAWFQFTIVTGFWLFHQSVLLLFMKDSVINWSISTIHATWLISFLELNGVRPGERMEETIDAEKSWKVTTAIGIFASVQGNVKWWE